MCLILVMVFCGVRMIFSFSVLVMVISVDRWGLV